MTVLSRLELRPRDLAVIRDLGDVAELHRTLMRAFPQSDDPSPRAQFGVLFRVEDDRSRKVVIVQSQAAPEWGLLPRGYLVDVQSKLIDTALASIASGRVLRFLLVANPSRKVARTGRLSQRVELTTDEARHQWLAGRGARHGFELAGAGEHDGVRIDRVLAAPGPGRRGVTVKSVRFEGRLRVTDAKRFVEAITGGIGPAKAYGCGLLSVAPV